LPRVKISMLDCAKNHSLANCVTRLTTSTLTMPSPPTLLVPIVQVLLMVKPRSSTRAPTVLVWCSTFGTTTNTAIPDRSFGPLKLWPENTCRCSQKLNKICAGSKPLDHHRAGAAPNQGGPSYVMAKVI